MMDKVSQAESCTEQTAIARVTNGWLEQFNTRMNCSHIKRSYMQLNINL